MSNLKPTVALTSVNSENMSRHQMLEWVNNLTNGHLKKIEEMCSGVAYCQMMEMIFPNCINLKRVKMSAKLEHECFHNMKLFQGALTHLKLDKTIPVDRLIKGRFQDNFEFLQWFKKFFDSQSLGLENLKPAGNAPLPKAIVKPRTAQTLEQDQKIMEETANIKLVLEELNTKVVKTIENRDKAYNKLREIELLLTDADNQSEHSGFCNRLLEVLYKEDRLLDAAPDEDCMETAETDDPNDGMY